MITKHRDREEKSGKPHERLCEPPDSLFDRKPFATTVVYSVIGVGVGLGFEVVSHGW